MDWLPLRGVIAPACMVLAVASGFLDFQLRAASLGWLSLLFLLLGLAFAADSRRLWVRAGRALRGEGVPAFQLTPWRRQMFPLRCVRANSPQRVHAEPFRFL
jgi:hypothetical protein